MGSGGCKKCLTQIQQSSASIGASIRKREIIQILNALWSTVGNTEVYLYRLTPFLIFASLAASLPAAALLEEAGTVIWCLTIVI